LLAVFSLNPTCRRYSVLLQDKRRSPSEGASFIGGSVAHAFARGGATVHLADGIQWQPDVTMTMCVT